jgi:hypothetical protein
VELSLPATAQIAGRDKLGRHRADGAGPRLLALAPGAALKFHLIRCRMRLAAGKGNCRNPQSEIVTGTADLRP